MPYVCKGEIILHEISELHYYPQSALKREISQSREGTRHYNTNMSSGRMRLGIFPLTQKGDYYQYRRCKNTFHPQKIFSLLSLYTLRGESLYMQMLSKHQIPNFIYPSVLLLLAPNCIFSEMMPNVRLF